MKRIRGWNRIVDYVIANYVILFLFEVIIFRSKKRSKVKSRGQEIRVE